jgi:diguanylate cyclase (GGDEF)-like protein
VLIAEDLRRRIAELDLEGPAGSLPVRISIGVAVLSDSYATAESLLAQADGAMYRAKHEGRNRVAVAEAEPGRS